MTAITASSAMARRVGFDNFGRDAIAVSSAGADGSASDTTSTAAMNL